MVNTQSQKTNITDYMCPMFDQPIKDILIALIAIGCVKKGVKFREQQVIIVELVNLTKLLTSSWP